MIFKYNELIWIKILFPYYYALLLLLNLRDMVLIQRFTATVNSVFLPGFTTHQNLRGFFPNLGDLTQFKHKCLFMPEIEF
jgi:hypothetical protein